MTGTMIAITIPLFVFAAVSLSCAVWILSERSDGGEHRQFTWWYWALATPMLVPLVVIFSPLIGLFMGLNWLIDKGTK